MTINNSNTPPALLKLPRVLTWSTQLKLLLLPNNRYKYT
jgi:hypothetical protein